MPGRCFIGEEDTPPEVRALREEAKHVPSIQEAMDQLRDALKGDTSGPSKPTDAEFKAAFDKAFACQR